MLKLSEGNQKELQTALFEIMAAVGSVDKSGYNTHGKYAYPKLADVMDTLFPLLIKKGLLMTEDATYDPEKEIVTITITVEHVASGATREWECAFPVKASGGQNPAQAVGAAITYGRKYLMLVAFNMATDEDTDNDKTLPTWNVRHFTWARENIEGLAGLSDLEIVGILYELGLPAPSNKKQVVSYLEAVAAHVTSQKS